MCLFDPVTILFEITHELVKIFSREVLTCGDHGSRICRQANSGKISCWIVFKIWCEHRRGDMRAHAASEQRVAVRSCRGDPRAAQSPTSTGYVFNHQLLSESTAHMFRYNASNDIARARRWERNHDGDCP